jgi:Helix-turn-helix domain
MPKGRKPGSHTPQKRRGLKGYYTPAEAAKKLGLSREMLYTYVRNERLTRHIPPGRKQGVFAREQVDELARELRAFVASSDKPTSVFARATPGDMDECAELINALFNHRPTVARWKQYLINNPDIGYLLRLEDKIVGCAFVMPLAPERIAEMFTCEETQTPSILPEEIKPYVPGIPFHLYVRAVGIHPDIGRAEKRLLGRHLISGLIKAIISLGERGIEIKTIQARSSTGDGIRTLRHMGFTEVPSTTASRNFLIDVEQSGIPEIVEYKAALARWKPNR